MNRANGTDGEDGAPPERVARPGSAAILGRLREMILSGELAPGTTISQTTLARTLGVSTTPLREVIRELQVEGFMEVELNRRPRVAPLDIVDMQAIYAARIMLEALGITLTVPLLTAADDEALLRNLDDMDALDEAGDKAAWTEVHTEFHRRLVGEAPPTIAATLRSLFDRSERYRRLLDNSGVRRQRDARDDHRRIVDACLARDAPAATAELARHLAHTALAFTSAFAPDSDPRPVRQAVRMVSDRTGAILSVSEAPPPPRRRSRSA